MALFDESKSENDLKIPYSIEAEEALLGSIFIKPDVIGDIVEIITPNDFYKNNYRIIFGEMLNVYNTGKIVDALVIKDSLEYQNLLDEIGGEDILYGLTDVVPTAANAVTYAQIIKERSVQRQLIETGERITRMAYRGYDDVEKMLDKAESMIFKIAESKQKKDVVSLKELAGLKISSLDEMSKYKGGLRGLSSGFTDYDSLTSGFHGSDLIILAARPAMGKTAFALNLALNVAKRGKHVLIFSLEMGNEQLFERLLSIDSKIKLKSIKDGTLADDDYTLLGNSMGRLSELPLYISDSSSVNILEIKAVARRLKAEGKLDFLLIDYLQLITPSEGSKKSREQEISEISRSLKIIAKELDIPVITLSQLSRGVESRNDKRPILSDLRESGAIEQDADMVMFLYREAYYASKVGMQPNGQNPNESNMPQQYTSQPTVSSTPELEEVEVIIGKHRSGPTGTIRLGFRPSYQQFVNIISDARVNQYPE
ncbi:replicative DNA helicase [Pseudoleptotrichia goodfellowii]|uniref:Replicative DNA helicase n=1 Tax=Pseudoleptotrichia goodfellowii TaxID=157692 RepID=A0A510J9A4_9FUSO|nr:replicative DNA helicase [Pseudoleptotrichia goodfellowii]BBM35878.1 replicative DNA helicase [Pseudoleptotrichia goodfellowii]